MSTLSETSSAASGDGLFSSDGGSAASAAGRDGELSAELARRLVQFHKDVHGRGPTAAKATICEDVAVVVLRGVLTKVERTLTDADRRREVVELRLRTGEVTRERRAGLVAKLLGLPVLAATAALDIDHDLLVETFVLAVG